MAARDFLNETFLPWLEQEIASDAKGNKHYIRGVEDTLKAITRTSSRTAISGIRPSEVLVPLP